MPVNRRQKRLYTYRVDLHAPVDGETGIFADDRFYSPTPTLHNVQCVIYNTDEYATVNVVGRMNRNNLDVIDKFHFSADVTLENGYLVHMLSPGVYFDFFWITQGNAKSRPAVVRRRSNVNKVFAYRTPKPSGF